VPPCVAMRQGENASSVTASEFIFLAMGLVLGLAAGAALVEIIRARPPAPREVRVTMSTDAVPRRSTTLADSAQTVSHAEPARGGPADRREGPGAMPDGTDDRRTAVRSGAAVMAVATVAADGPDAGPQPGQLMEPAFPLHDPTRAPGDPVPSTAGAIPISGGTDPLMGAFRASAAASAVAASAAMRSSTTTAVLEAEGPRSDGAGSGQPGAGGGLAAGLAAPASGSPGGDLPAAPVTDGPCAEVRRVAAERCELATRARDQATVAADALRAAQRGYDDHEARAAEAQAAADPRAIRQAKDAAQQRFRDGRGMAGTNDEVEAAARAWLAEVNAINAAAREATTALARERAAAQTLGLSLERLALEADAARISAETAAAACLEAREAAAACDEEASTGTSAVPPVHAPGDPFPTDDADPAAETLAAALAGGGGTPRIFRLLRGDRAAMAEIVAAIAGDDPESRRRWQLAIAGLVDAILADAIEAGTMDFPTEHSFWGPFTVSQDRDIVRALASLGYRFDGLGGWLDERVPSQRDLSLALGYAGLDPMRMRHWPNETEMADLFADVTVAADEHLAGAAGDLTLGELVSMLDRRADGLADLWNDWGRIRPLLLEAA
jgi:hypothetical protein